MAVNTAQNKANTYAYIRVSSKEQNEERQRHTMQSNGVQDSHIYVDKLSGKDTDRPQYQALKLEVKAGDTVIFDSITRMSRSMDDIEDEYKWFTDRNISLQFVNEPTINYDVNKVEHDPIMRAIPKMVLTILSAFAEKERTDIRERQRQGIEAARRQGKHLGRPRISYHTMSNDEKKLFKTQYSRWKNEDQTAVETMNNIGLKKSTFYKVVKEYEELMNNE